MREERVLLWNVRCVSILWSDIRNLLSVQLNGSASYRFKPCNETKQRCLSGTCRPQDADLLAIGYLQADSIDRLCSAECPGYIQEFDGRHDYHVLLVTIVSTNSDANEVSTKMPKPSPMACGEAGTVPLTQFTMRTGAVVSFFATARVAPVSSMLRVKAMIAPATKAYFDSGIVSLRNIMSGLAPKVRATSST